MKTFLPRMTGLLFLLLQPLAAVPEKLELVDGRVLEQVSEALLEDGKVKVTHSGGTGRFKPAALTRASQRALGLTVQGSAEPAILRAPAISRLETLDGKVFEEIRSLRVQPSYISFVHKDGSASVRFEQLPEQVKRQCGYDPALAERFDREEALRQHAAERVELAAELAISKAKSRAVARAEARDQAFRAAVVGRIQRGFDLRREYGHDLGDYIHRNEGSWQRESDLRAALRAKALHRP